MYKDNRLTITNEPIAILSILNTKYNLAQEQEWEQLLYRTIFLGGCRLLFCGCATPIEIQVIQYRM